MKCTSYNKMEQGKNKYKSTILQTKINEEYHQYPVPLQYFAYPTDMPTLLSFSGGRTSGYMLAMTLLAYGGTLPEGVKVVFFNTGKEMSETLDFVRDCGEKFGVKITWLEYCPESEFNTKLVDYKTASRHGEPFAALIKKRTLLPNPVTRFCTTELKIRRGYMFMHKMLGYKHWYSIVGIRYDEEKRWIKIQNQARRERWTTLLPLVTSATTLQMVNDYWGASLFKLDLPNHKGVTPPLGNCDLCFLKGTNKIKSIVRDFPHLAKWWIDQENSVKTRMVADVASGITGSRFRLNAPRYQTILDNSKNQALLIDGIDDEYADCTCTD